MASESLVPITDISPSHPSRGSAAIRAIVTLIWPYSSATSSCALLLAEPDFRLRRRKGQVRIQVFGLCAQKVAESGIGIGDEIILGIKDAEWETAGGTVSTPGKSIDWELHFRNRLGMKICRNGTTVSNLQVQNTSLNSDATTPAPARHSLNPLDRLRTTHQASPRSSPAFLKTRLSDGTYFEAGYDPLQDERATKRRRTSWRESYEWKFVDGQPTPMKGDALLADDEESLFGSSSQRYATRSHDLESPTSRKTLQVLQKIARSESPEEMIFSNGSPVVPVHELPGVLHDLNRAIVPEEMQPSELQLPDEEELTHPSGLDMGQPASGSREEPAWRSNIAKTEHSRSQGQMFERRVEDVDHPNTDTATSSDLVDRFYTQHDFNVGLHSTYVNDGSSPQYSSTEENTVRDSEDDDSVIDVDEAPRRLEYPVSHSTMPVVSRAACTIDEAQSNDDHAFDDDDDDDDDDGEGDDEVVDAFNHEEEEENDSEQGEEDEEYSEGDYDNSWMPKHYDPHTEWLRHKYDDVDSDAEGYSTTKEDTEEDPYSDNGEDDENVSDMDSEYGMEGEDSPVPPASSAPVVIDLLSDSEEEEPEEELSANRPNQPSSSPVLAAEWQGVSKSDTQEHEPSQPAFDLAPTHLPQQNIVGFTSINTAGLNDPHWEALSATQAASSAAAQALSSYDYLLDVAQTTQQYGEERVPASITQDQTSGDAIIPMASITGLNTEGFAVPNETDYYGVVNADENIVAGQLLGLSEPPDHSTFLWTGPEYRTTTTAVPPGPAYDMTGYEVALAPSIDPYRPLMSDQVIHDYGFHDPVDQPIDTRSTVEEQSQPDNLTAFGDLVDPRLMIDGAAERFIPDSAAETRVTEEPVSTTSTQYTQKGEGGPVEADQVHQGTPNLQRTETSEPTVEDAVLNTVDTPRPIIIDLPSDFSDDESEPEAVTSYLTHDDAASSLDDLLIKPHTEQEHDWDLTGAQDETTEATNAKSDITKVEKATSELVPEQSTPEQATYAAREVPESVALPVVRPDFQKPILRASPSSSVRLPSSYGRLQGGILYVKDSEEDSVHSEASISTQSALEAMQYETVDVSYPTASETSHPEIEQSHSEPQTTSAESRGNQAAYFPQRPDVSPITQAFTPRRRGPALSIDSPTADNASHTSEGSVRIGDFSEVDQTVHGNSHISQRRLESTIEFARNEVLRITQEDMDKEEELAVDAVMSSPPPFVPETLDLGQLSSPLVSPIQIVPQRRTASAIDERQNLSLDNVQKTAFERTSASREAGDLRPSRSSPDAHRSESITGETRPLSDEVAYSDQTQASSGALRPFPITSNLHASQHSDIVHYPDLPMSQATTPSVPYQPSHILLGQADSVAPNDLITPDPSQLDTMPAHLDTTQHGALQSLLPPTPQMTQISDLYTESPEPSSAVEAPESADDRLVISPTVRANDRENPLRNAVSQQQSKVSLDNENIKNVDEDQREDGFMDGIRRSIRGSGVPKALSPWFATQQSSAKVDMSSPLAKQEAHKERPLAAWSNEKVADEGNKWAGMLTPPSTKPKIDASSQAKQDSPLPSSQQLSQSGLRTPLSYYTLLFSLHRYLNSPNAQADVLAVCASGTKGPVRVPNGPRDFYVSFDIADRSVFPSCRNVQIFRPWKASLPVTRTGDVVLLRNMTVKGHKTKRGENTVRLISGEDSAWCVWRYAAKPDVDKKPVWAKRAGAERFGEEDVRGPPVEIGDQERGEARELSEWWYASASKPTDTS